MYKMVAQNKINTKKASSTLSEQKAAFKMHGFTFSIAVYVTCNCFHLTS